MKKLPYRNLGPTLAIAGSVSLLQEGIQANVPLEYRHLFHGLISGTVIYIGLFSMVTLLIELIARGRKS